MRFYLGSLNIHLNTKNFYCRAQKLISSPSLADIGGK